MSKSIVKNYIYNVMYQILVLIAPLVTAPYLARVLGAESLGVYSYVYTVGSVISSIGLLGLYNYGVRQIAYTDGNDPETNYVFWEIMLVRFLLLVPGCLIYLLMGILNDSIFVFLAYLPWLLASYIDISWIYVGKEDMKPTVIKNGFAKVASVIGIFVLVKDSSDVWKYLALIAVSTLIANLSVWVSVGKYIGKPKIRVKKLSVHLSGAVNLFLPQVATIIYLQVDKLMLKWIAGSNQIAFYDQADKIIHIPLAFITVLGAVMMPRIANEFKKDNKEKISNLINSAIRFSCFLSVPLFLGLCGIAKNFVPWYLGGEFLPVINVIYFISPIVVFNSFTSILGGQYLMATNQVKVLTKSHLYAAVANIVLNGIMIPLWGCVGAAIATVVSSLLSVLIQYMSVKKQIKLIMFDSFILKCIIASLVMFVVVILIGEYFKVGVIATLIQIVCGVCVYFISLLIMKEKYIIEIIKKLIMRKSIEE